MSRAAPYLPVSCLAEVYAANRALYGIGISCNGWPDLIGLNGVLSRHETEGTIRGVYVVGGFIRYHRRDDAPDSHCTRVNSLSHMVRYLRGAPKS